MSDMHDVQMLWAMVYENPNIDWDYVGLCKLPYIDWFVINKYVNKPWDWVLLSIRAPKVIIMNNLNNYWIWCIIASRNDIVWDSFSSKHTEYDFF